jgi:mono/diheme cytochrome c family protein
MFFTLTLFFACGDHEHKHDTATVIGGEADLDNGSSVYQGCMVCHNGNDIDIIDKSRDLSDEELAGIIENGSGAMTPQTQLSSEDIRDVITYIRSQE